MRVVLPTTSVPWQGCSSGGHWSRLGNARWQRSKSEPNNSPKPFHALPSGEVWGEDSLLCLISSLTLSLFQRERGSDNARVGERLMTFTQSCTISAGREAVWDFLMDMQNIAQCLP